MASGESRALGPQDDTAEVPDHHAPYKSTATRGPSQAPIAVPQTVTELASVPTTLIDSLGGNFCKLKLHYVVFNLVFRWWFFLVW